MKYIPLSKESQIDLLFVKSTDLSQRSFSLDRLILFETIQVNLILQYKSKDQTISELRTSFTEEDF
jgi:hypothetical protein